MSRRRNKTKRAKSSSVATNRPINKDFSEKASFNGIEIAYARGVDYSIIKMLNQYSVSPWLRSVVDRVSSSFSMAEWKIYKRPPSRIGKRNFSRVVKQIETLSLQPEDNNEFIEFWNRGNKKISGFSCRKLIQQYIDLVGECYLVLDFDKKTKKPIYYSPVPADWVQKEGKKYIIRTGLGESQSVYSEDEVVHLVSVNPLDPYRLSSSISGAIKNELALDAEASSYAADYFHNGMMPSGILSVPGATKGQVEKMRYEWENQHQGLGKRHKIQITGAEVGYTRTEQEFAPENIVKIREFERNVVMQVFGVPPEILGILDNSNRASIKSAEEIYAKMVILPRLKFIQAEIQEKIVSKYFSEDLYLDFYSPMPADTQLEVEVMKFAPYAFKINEFRALARKRPLSKEEGGEEMGALLDIRGQAEAGSTMRGKPANDQNPESPESVAKSVLSSGDASRLDALTQICPIDEIRVSSGISGNMSKFDDYVAKKCLSFLKTCLVKSHIKGEPFERCVERIEESHKDNSFWVDPVHNLIDDVSLIKAKADMFHVKQTSVEPSRMSRRIHSECKLDHSLSNFESISKSVCKCIVTEKGLEADGYIEFQKVFELERIKHQRELISLCKNYMDCLLREISSD